MDLENMFSLESDSDSMMATDFNFPQASSAGSSFFAGFPSVSDIFSTLGTAALIRGANEIAGRGPAPTAKQGSEGILGKLGTVGVSLDSNQVIKIALVLAAVGAGLYLLLRKA